MALLLKVWLFLASSLPWRKTICRVAEDGRKVCMALFIGAFAAYYHDGEISSLKFRLTAAMAFWLICLIIEVIAAGDKK